MRYAWLLVVAVSSGAEPRKTALPPLPDTDLPYRQQPIDYFGNEAADRVAQLAAELQAGTRTLAHEETQGYLRAFLEAVEVPLASQTLVFSKSSANVRLISPSNPRAIYFNNDVYVGWIPGSSVLEISAVDPQKGALFYTLNQDSAAPPKLTRQESCLLCHASTTSLKVPGHLVRSFTTDRQGRMTSGYSRITQDTPFENRWGGWYVTGTHGRLQHMGNLVGNDAVARHRREPAFGGNVVDLTDRFDVSRYLSPHSDIVALLILDHQVHLHNLFTRVNHETRLGRPSQAEELLLRYLLFADAPPLPAPVKGTPTFAEWFQAQGPRDGGGRSLRELDLTERVPRYRLSHLISSPAFLGLPTEPRGRIYRRLWEILTGADQSDLFAYLPAAERKAILEILLATQPELPDYWRIPTP